MLWTPGSRPAVVSTAVPSAVGTAASSVSPSKNRIVPEGEPAAGAAAATVAVKRTGISNPVGDGFDDSATATDPLTIVSAPFANAIA